jgi:serine/threonine protein kinase
MRRLETQPAIARDEEDAELEPEEEIPVAQIDPPTQDIAPEEHTISIHETAEKPEEPPKSEEDRKPADPKNDLDYEVGNTLGRGSYAIVKLAFEKSTKRLVALKIYEKESLNDPTKLTNVLREIKILSMVKHPNIINMHKCLETPREVCNSIPTLFNEYRFHSFLNLSVQSPWVIT